MRETNLFLTMYPDSSEGLNKETDSEILFFTPAFHVFDNFSAHAVTIWGQTFPTAEHAYQWKKMSHNPELSKQILSARSPEMANRISKNSKGEVSEGWHENKVEIMEEIIRVKVAQNEDVKEVLRRSGHKEIIEHSPVSAFWGNGPDNNGQNMIGKIWMEIRKELLIKS